MTSSTSGQFVRVSAMRSVTGIATASSRQSWCGSVVSEDARGYHYTGADARPAADPELGGGAPANADCVMGGQRVLAGRTTLRGGDRHVNEGGRGRVHDESVSPASRLMVIAWDRRSGVSGGIPRWSNSTPRAASPEPNVAVQGHAGGSPRQQFLLDGARTRWGAAEYCSGGFVVIPSAWPGLIALVPPQLEAIRTRNSGPPP